jgi:DNA gyrase subunit A
MALTTRSEDVVEHLFVTTTHHYFLFFTNLGLVYRLKVHEIPDASRQAKGTALVNLLNLKAGEVVTAVIPVRDFAQHQYLILATRRGVVKKTSLDQYDSSRRDGLIALHLDEGDELIGVKASDGDNEVVLATRKGLAIRFLEEEVRPMGRNTRGVRGISLKAGDDVVSMDLIRPGNFLVAVTNKGYGKITPEEGYRRQRRGGKGILTLRTTGRNGQLVTLKVASAEDELMLITREGVIIRLGVGGISIQGRSTQGVLLQRLDPKDQVVAVATIAGGREGEEPDLH